MTMLKTENFEGKALIQYYKRRYKRTGVVVAIASGIIGWSLCSKNDKFDSDKAIFIALARAQKSGRLFTKERSVYYSTIPQSLTDLTNKLLDRSEKYFRYDLD